MERGVFSMSTKNMIVPVKHEFSVNKFRLSPKRVGEMSRYERARDQSAAERVSGVEYEQYKIHGTLGI